MKSPQKYAAAFLNISGDELTPEQVANIEQAAIFLAEHRRALFLLKVPIIPETIKEQGLQELCDRFELPGKVRELMQLLMQHKRATMLARVLHAIVVEYRERNQYTLVRVTTVEKLSDEQKKTIEQFADRKFPGKKQYRYRQDRMLIAGVRLQSDTLLWEYSIDNYLREWAQAQVW